jgi:serine/threonine-protein kinase RsbW
MPCDHGGLCGLTAGQAASGYDTGPQAGPARDAVARVVIASDPLAVRQGLGVLFATPLMRALSADDRGTAEIVLAEAVNNIVEHAYATYSGTIELTLTCQGASLCCSLIDHGLSMPGDQLPAGRLGSPEDLAEGGFGWHLIRTLSQDLAYARDGTRNRLSFRLVTGQSGA